MKFNLFTRFDGNVLIYIVILFNLGFSRLWQRCGKYNTFQLVHNGNNNIQTTEISYNIEIPVFNCTRL